MIAEIATGKSVTMRRKRISIVPYELRIGLEGERLKGKGHAGSVIATTTSGNGYPRWMVELKDKINAGDPHIVAAIIKARLENKALDAKGLLRGPQEVL